MRLIDQIVVKHRDTDRLVQLFVGDVTDVPAHEAVDLLVVSAFPSHYTPSYGTVIQSLQARNISVAELAQNKAVDLREFSCCWLSQPLDRPDLHFRRVLCFEPMFRGRAPDVVGDIFRSLVPFTEGSTRIARIAAPIVASGYQQESVLVMLEAIVKAAVNWLALGLSLECIKIVARISYDTADEDEYRAAFARVKEAISHDAADPSSASPHYDVFISYAHEDEKEVRLLVEDLLSRRCELRVFLDRLELKPGMSWQQHIFEALDDSRRVVSVLSPDYLASKVCKEEFNIAMVRHRESSEEILTPLYLRSANLPTYMRLLQYVDSREADRSKIEQAAQVILDRLPPLRR